MAGCAWIFVRILGMMAVDLVMLVFLNLRNSISISISISLRFMLWVGKVSSELESL